MKKLIYAIVCLLSTVAIQAQNMSGEIIGKVIDPSDNQPIIGAKIWVEVGESVLYTISNNDGRFRISSIPSGTYTLFVKYSSDTMMIQNQYVRPDGICAVPDISFSSEFTTGDVNFDYAVNPIIQHGNEHMVTLSPEDIRLSVNRQDLGTLIENMSSDIQRNTNGDMIIRGSRPGDVIYFVDGVKTNDLSVVPGSSIGGVTVYTGGIPAKYGDTTGGVIILETKSYFDLYRAWRIATGN